MPVSSVTEHWIKPDAVTINLNHFGDPDYLQVSVLAGAVVMAFKQDVIAYNAAHNYRTWPLQAANTYLETTSAYNVYARLTRSEVNASALIVYDPILRDIEGRPISLSENGEEVLGDADSTYFYVFLGQISSSIESSGQSTSREWIVDFRFGQLNTSEQLKDVNALLFKLFTPHFEDPLDPSKLTWIEAKSHIGVNGGVTMFVANDDIDLPVIYDGLPIDGQTLVWEETSDGKILKINPNIDLGGTSSWSELEGKPSWITDSKPIYNYSEIKNTPDLSVFVTGTALNKTLADYATLTYLTGELKNYVSLDGAQDITGVKNFINGLEIGGMKLSKSQEGVVYLDGNLVVRGGITMYAENEVDIPSILDSLPIASNTALGIASFDSTYFSVDSNGMVSLTSAPSSGASSLGELLNVDASIDATASVDRVLYQPAGSATWTWKELTSSGVVGDYLPLSGGRLYGNLGINIDRSAHGLHVKGSVAIGQNISGTATLDAFGGMAFFGCDAVINGVVQANKTAYIAANGNNGCVSVGHYDAQYKLDVLSSNHQVLKVESTAENLESSIRYVNKSKEVWVVGSQVGGHGNSFSFWHDNEAKTTMSIQKNGCFHVWFNGASIPNNNNTYVEGIRLYGKTKDNSWSEINLGCDPSLTYGSHSNQWVIARCGDAPYINELVFRAGWNDHFIFYRNGDFRVAGGITMYSDQRKKTILNHVELSLKQIANAPLIEHYYNSDQEKTTHVGSIAQYWANLNDWFCKLDAEGFYTMEIQNCALASAISIARHLEKYESKTDKKIRMLKKRVQELEEEVERLKQN